MHNVRFALCSLLMYIEQRCYSLFPSSHIFCFAALLLRFHLHFYCRPRPTSFSSAAPEKIPRAAFAGFRGAHGTAIGAVLRCQSAELLGGKKRENDVEKSNLFGALHEPLKQIYLRNLDCVECCCCTNQANTYCRDARNGLFFPLRPFLLRDSRLFFIFSSPLPFSLRKLLRFI